MFNFFSKNKFKNITAIDAEKNLNNISVKFVDVRNLDEYNNGHIENSILIPVRNAEQITKTIPDKNTKIIVNCHSGMRSKKACKIFTNLGYTNIYNLEGGILSWTGKIIK